MSTTKKLAQVLHYDLQGKREFKYDFLNENSLATIEWNILEPNEPNYFLVKKNFDESGMYELGFKMDELFVNFSGGIQTKRDKLFLDLSYNEIKLRLSNLLEGKIDTQFKNEFNIANSSSYFLLEKIAKSKFLGNRITKINYYPFDSLFIYYDKDLIGRPFFKVMYNFINKNNIGLVMPKQSSEMNGCIVSDKIIGQKLFSAYDINYAFPLYLYPETTAQQSIDQTINRTPNLNTEIVNQIAKKIGLTFTIEKETTKGTFAPIDILDYIYAVLHSPTYREKYKEFLKIDFPRVPYPKDEKIFWSLVALGSQIRQIHLLESPTVSKYITQYPIDGDNVVTKIKFVECYEIIRGNTVINIDPLYPIGRVYINETQYFEMVPKHSWEFFIGGYQPAQKWLKDRKERTLEFDDILHYQKIIVALSETNRLMQQINSINIE